MNSCLQPQLEKDGRQIHYIRGDGNCFFRAISRNIRGDERYHGEIRRKVADIMEKYAHVFAEFIDGDLAEHVRAMRRDGTWATTAEIFAAAVLLQRDIYVLSPHCTEQKYEWMQFSPKIKLGENTRAHPCYLTLCHTNGNHYDCIVALNGACNCTLPPPKLCGVQDYVDLTRN